MQAYLNTLPSSVRSGVDEHDFNVELLLAQGLPAMVEAAKKAATADDEAFQIDRQRLEASIVVDDRYKFVYVLDRDGWKMFGPVGAGP